MYNAEYGLSGACKSHNMPPWACCAGTRIQAVADYHDLIFFKDDESLYVVHRPRLDNAGVPGSLSRFSADGEIEFYTWVPQTETRLPGCNGAPAPGA